MKDFSLQTMIAIFEEMLGVWLWAGVAFAAIVGLLFLAALLRQGGFRGGLARLATAAGAVGAIIAAAVAPAMTQAGYGNLHGVIDWTLLLSIAFAAFIGITITVYGALGLAAPRA